MIVPIVTAIKTAQHDATTQNRCAMTFYTLLSASDEVGQLPGN
jgi:hypothetical protein